MNASELTSYQLQQANKIMSDHEHRIRELEKAVQELSLGLANVSSSIEQGSNTLHEGVKILSEMSRQMSDRPNQKMLVQILVWAGGAVSVMVTVLFAGFEYYRSLLP